MVAGRGRFPVSELKQLFLQARDFQFQGTDLVGVRLFFNRERSDLFGVLLFFSRVRLGTRQGLCFYGLGGRARGFDELGVVCGERFRLGSARREFRGQGSLRGSSRGRLCSQLIVASGKLSEARIGKGRVGRVV